MYRETAQEMTAALYQVQEKGVSLYLEGKPADPMTIAYHCVCEEETYMADYVLDDAGILRELRYDRITDC
ncbi:MAG: hypothetical protein ACI4SA_04355 [Lachnospiraceae bacterium]